MTEEQIREELSNALSVPSTADLRGLIREIAGKLVEGTWRIGHDTASHTAYGRGSVNLSRQGPLMEALDYEARRIHDTLSNSDEIIVAVDPLDDPKDKLSQWVLAYCPVSAQSHLFKIVNEATENGAVEAAKDVATRAGTDVHLYKLDKTIKVSVEYLVIEGG